MNKNVVRCVLFSFTIGSTVACAQKGTAESAAVQLENEDQKTLYALGLVLGQNVEEFALKPEELAFVKAGFADGAARAKPQVELKTYGPKINELAQKRRAAGSEETKTKGKEFADEVAKQAGATRTASGIVIRPISPGSGASPTASDVVKVHYEGKLIDGTVFDSSIADGKPVEFQLGRVVPCWSEGLQQFKKGEKAQIVCPSDLAYGDRGSPPTIPPGATLSFEVELLDFHKP